MRVYDGWDHSPAGYITDYILAAICVALASLALTSWQINTGAKQLATLCVITTIVFTAGGISHHVLDIYFQNGETMGKNWGEENSVYLYAWLLTGFVATASSAMACLTFKFTSCASSTWISVILYTLGIGIGIYEAWALCQGNFASSGVVAALASIVFGLIAFSFVVVVACSQGLGANIVLLGCGSFLWFVGYAFLLLAVPQSCLEVGELCDGCPYPENFNQNAIFHVILIAAVVATGFGVQQSPSQFSALLSDE